MRRQRVFVAVVLLAGVALFLVYRRGQDGEAQRIRRRVEDLARVLCVQSGESPISRAAKANRAAGFFVPAVTVDLAMTGWEPYAIEGRDNLRDTLLAVLGRVQSSSVEFLDVLVHLDADRSGAEAEAHFTARVGVPGERGFDAQEFKMRMVREGDTWMIAAVRTVKTIGR